MISLPVLLHLSCRLWPKHTGAGIDSCWAFHTTHKGHESLQAHHQAMACPPESQSLVYLPKPHCLLYRWMWPASWYAQVCACILKEHLEICGIPNRCSIYTTLFGSSRPHVPVSSFIFPVTVLHGIHCTTLHFYVVWTNNPYLNNAVYPISR